MRGYGEKSRYLGNLMTDVANVDHLGRFRHLFRRPPETKPTTRQEAKISPTPQSTRQQQHRTRAAPQQDSIFTNRTGIRVKKDCAAGIGAIRRPAPTPRVRTQRGESEQAGRRASDRAKRRGKCGRRRRRRPTYSRDSGGPPPRRKCKGERREGGGRRGSGRIEEESLSLGLSQGSWSRTAWPAWGRERETSFGRSRR